MHCFSGVFLFFVLLFSHIFISPHFQSREAIHDKSQLFASEMFSSEGATCLPRLMFLL